MKAQKFIGRVLSDGHLSVPRDTAKEIGKVYEVILTPVDEPYDIYSYAESLAEEKGFAHYSEAEIEKIIHEVRGIA